jgi:hypothetical protein
MRLSLVLRLKISQNLSEKLQYACIDNINFELSQAGDLQDTHALPFSSIQMARHTPGYDHFPILQDDSFVLHVSTLGFWRRRQNNDGVVTDRLLCRWASTATTKRCHPDPQSRNQPLLHLCAVCSSMHKHYAKSHTEMHMAPACTLVLVASAGENGIWC